MRHPSTKSLYAYWLELLPKQERDAPPLYPPRSAIEPAAMRRWLGDVFILQDDMEAVRYRLAGTRLCALYGEELAGTAFVNAFEGADRSMARSWTATFGSEAIPLLISSRAENATGASVTLETLILPLSASTDSHADRRALGVTTASASPHWLGITPIVRQEVTSVRVIRDWAPNPARADYPIVRPAADGRILRLDRRDRVVGRQVAHLTVLDGGLN